MPMMLRMPGSKSFAKREHVVKIKTQKEDVEALSQMTSRLGSRHLACHFPQHDASRDS